MKQRLITAGVGLVVMALVLFAYHTPLFNLVIAGIALIAIHEVYAALQLGKSEWPLYLALVPYTLLIMLSSSIRVRGLLMPGAFLLMLFCSIYMVVRNGTVNFQKVGGYMMFTAIILYCFYSFIQLKIMLPRGQYGYDGVFFTLLILCFAWGGDTCAYFVGRALGKHKLCPVVSPHKTVEGAVGGVLGTMLFGMGATVIYAAVAGRSEHFSQTVWGMPLYLVVGLLGLVAAVLGIFGDLFASVVKRQNGIKDYGTIFPGHGGILDRFDSVLFIAPFVTLALTAVVYGGF